MIDPYQTPPETLRHSIRWLLYAVLAVSAASTFFLGNQLWAAAETGNLPIWVALCPIVAFTAFVGVYSIDRWLLVRRQGYPAARAFLQVAMAAAFLSLLWPHQASSYRRTQQNRPNNPVVSLLSHRDKRVRAAACELLSYRGDATNLTHLENMANADSAEEVREACREAVIKLRQ